MIVLDRLKHLILLLAGNQWMRLDVTSMLPATTASAAKNHAVKTGLDAFEISELREDFRDAMRLIVYWFGSDLFYANIDRFATQVRKLATESPSPVLWLVVDTGAITSVDYTAGGALKELVKDLAQHGVELVFAHISESLKADLNRHGLTEVIGPNRQFETLRECLAAYASRTR